MSILKTLTINGTTYSVTPVVPASSITLLASAWVGDGESYSQVVAVPGATAYTKVDLLPSSEQLAEFHHKVLAFVAENNGGVVTVYAIGDKPTGDHTIQITKTEVQGTGKIRGNTVGTSMPRPDWNQTDPTKADYIKNKPDISGVGGSGGGTVSNAVLYTAQALIDGQKTQARKNIGAIGNGENINLNGKSISGAYQVTFIQNADDGKPVRMSKGVRDGEPILYMQDVASTAPVFVQGIKAGVQDTDAVNVAQLNDAIASVGGGSGGVATMIVRTQNDDYADETAEVINQHISRGGLAYFFDGDYYYPLAADIANSVSIGLVRTYDEKFLYVEIDVDGTVTYVESDYSDLADNLSGVAKDVLDLMQQMGDIETALDRIIDIQNELIGGGA